MFKAKSLKSAPAATLQAMMGSLEPIARRTGFCVRSHRKISPEGFLLSLLKSVCCGQGSLNQLAMFVGHTNHNAPSRQAVHKRLGASSSAFLQAVLDKILRHKIDPHPDLCAFSFGRVLIEDSVQFKTHRANHESYPGLGNSSGSTAGCKVDVSFDLLAMEPMMEKQVCARTQDRVLGPMLLTLVKANDLVIRDMGYFSLADFKQIEAGNAFWLSRLPSAVQANRARGQSLEDSLKKSRKRIVDLKVRLGAAQHQARLIAVRVEDDVCAKRRRQRRAKSKKQGHTPRKKSLFRDQWSIYVTNLRMEQMPARAVVQLYKVRWAVEIQFRAWKQSTKVQAALNRITNKHHLEALMLGAMIFQVLTLRMVQHFKRTDHDREFSSEKIADWLAGQLLTATSMHTTFVADLRHLSHDCRIRHLLVDTLQIIRRLS
jgi:hypothetical protein